MERWSRYLHQEAVDTGYEILDTTNLSLAAGVRAVLSILMDLCTGLFEQG